MLRNEGKGHFCSFFGTQCQNYLLFLKLAKNGKGGWSKPPHLKIIPSIPGREGDRFLTTATLGMGGTDRGGVLAEAAHGVGLPHPHRRCEVLPHAQQQRGAEQPPPVVHLDPAGDQVGEGEVTPPPTYLPTAQVHRRRVLEGGDSPREYGSADRTSAAMARAHRSAPHGRDGGCTLRRRWRSCSSLAAFVCSSRLACSWGGVGGRGGEGLAIHNGGRVV